MGSYAIQKFKYKPTNPEALFRDMADDSYKPLVEIIARDAKMKIEGDVLKAIHSYGIKVDKDELAKALQYDRDQYRQGFVDGCQSSMVEVVRMVFDEINAIKKEYASGNIDGNEMYLRLYTLEKKYTEGE